MNKLLFTAFLLLNSVAYAGAHKWFDEQGNVHYSDQIPPAHVQAKSILDKPVVAGGIASVSTTKHVNANATKSAVSVKKSLAGTADQETASGESKQKNCFAAKQNLANLRDGMRISVVESNAEERSVLDELQRQKNTEEAQQRVAKFCQ